MKVIAQEVSSEIKDLQLHNEGHISLPIKNTPENPSAFMDIFEIYSRISGKNVKLYPKERESGCYQIYPQQYSKQDNNGTLF